MSASTMKCPKCRKVFTDPAEFRKPDGKDHYSCITCRQSKIKPGGWDLGRALRKSAGMMSMHSHVKLGPEITPGMMVKLLAAQNHTCPVLGVRFELPGDQELKANQTLINWAKRAGKNHRQVPLLVRLRSGQGWVPGNLIFACSALSDALRLCGGSVEGLVTRLELVLNAKFTA